MPILPEIGKVPDQDFVILEIKNNNVEEGIECFNHWLSIQDGGDKNDEDNIRNSQLILKVFER